jgi:hypothetical protein
VLIWSGVVMPPFNVSLGKNVFLPPSPADMRLTRKPPAIRVVSLGAKDVEGDLGWKAPS